MEDPPTLTAEALSALDARLRARPVRDLADPERLGPLLEALLGADFTAELLVPALRALSPYLRAVLREDDRPLASYLPEEARLALVALIERPPRLPAPLAQAILENPALEEVLRDLLYEALLEFNDRVNPFFADWGLPTIIRRVLPIGGATVVRTLEAVRGEFDRRLEPEMRRFLQGFVKRGLRRFTTVLVEGKDGEKARVLRRSVLEAMLGQPVSLLAAAADAEAQRLAEDAAAAILVHLVPSERMTTLMREALAALVSAAGDRTLGEFLEDQGLRHRVQPATLAALLSHLL